jgi:hypothetical protein
MMKKHQVTKIVLERLGKRVIVHGTPVWLAATSVVQGWAQTSNLEIAFEVHYDDGEAFIGHIDPSHGNLDVATQMRQFCEFYALRHPPSCLDLREREQFERRVLRIFRREHLAAIRWLDSYEIGGSEDFERTMPSLVHEGECIEGTQRSEFTPAPMTPTPSWS